MNSISATKQSFIEQIYRDYKELIYNFIYRLCSDPDQALDVTQQTFIKIMTVSDLNEIENIKSYLFTIARNYLYDTWKKKKETLFDDAGIDIASSIAEGEMNDELAKQQLQNAVVYCVQRLADKYREIMVLRYIEDLSIKEIALITKRSISDIKVSLLRGRQQFNKGLTKHMYLKVAKSRQRCDQMNTMLVPYLESDIPEDELASFEKHIDKCAICTEDAEELKRNRKLFALMPLIGVPLSLDTSFNDAMAASSTLTKPMPDTNTISNAMMVKIAVSVTVVALIVAAIYLTNNKNNNLVPTKSPQSVQSVTVNSSPTTVAQSDAKVIPVPFNIKARLAAETDPIEVHWILYRINSNNKSSEQLESLYLKELSLKLNPGEYRILTQIDDVEIERFFKLEPGKPTSLEIVINRGSVNFSTPLIPTIKMYDSGITYLLYKSRQDLEKNKYFTLKKFRQPEINFILLEGDYFVKATYTGFGDIETVQSFTIKTGETTNIEIPIMIGMFKPEALLSKKNLSYSKYKNINWSAKKLSAPKNTATSFTHFSNGSEVAMAAGRYIVTAQLDKITQQSSLIIKHGQVTSHQVILRGGIIKSAIWVDSSRTKRSTTINVHVYDLEKYKQSNNGSSYLENLAYLPNNSPDSFSILPEGHYILVVKNIRDHNIITTRQFTIEDGDTKFIQLVSQK